MKFNVPLSLTFFLSSFCFVPSLRAQIDLFEPGIYDTAVNKNLVFIGQAKLTAAQRIDSVGSGYIRLTDTISQTGGIYIDEAFPSDMGVVVEFEYLSWKRSADSPADGTSVFLFDAKYGPGSFQLGSSGAGLGYGGAGGVGLSGGYLGVGLDEYGNWGKAYYFGDGGLFGFNSSRRFPNVSIRGPSPQTPFIKGAVTNTLGLQLYSKRNPTRPSPNVYFRQFRVAILFDAKSGKYNVSVHARTEVNENWRQLLAPKELNISPPDSLKVGLAASTGAEHAFHELRNLKISTPGEIRVTATVPTNVPGRTPTSYTVTVHNDSPSDLDGVSFTDVLPPGFVADGQPVFNGRVLGNTLLSGGYTSNGIYEASLDVMHNSSCTFTFKGKFTNIRRDTLESFAYAKVPPKYTDTDIHNDTARLVFSLLSPYESFGDAPASYGVAEHRVDYTLHLGTWDSTRVQLVPAHSDAANTAANDDAASILFAGTATVVEELKSPDFYIDSRGALVALVSVNTLGKNANLFAWMDFNRNGKFEANEAANVAVTRSGKVRLAFDNALSRLRDGVTYMRLRLSTDPALNSSHPDGTLLDGDVEDYMIHIDAIKVNKTVSPATVRVGDTVSYHIEIENHFPFAMSLSGIFDTLSPYLSYLSVGVTPTPTTDTPVAVSVGGRRRQVVKWGPGSPPPGGKTDYRFKAVVIDAPQIHGDSVIENFAVAMLNGGEIRSQPRAYVKVKAAMAVEDIALTTVGRPVTVNLLDNDVFHGCTKTNVSVVARALGAGSVSTDANKNAVYTPDAGRFGIDSLSYVLTGCRPNIDPDSAKVYVLTLKPDALKYLVCPGVSATLGMASIPGVSYRWYDSRTGVTPIPGGDDADSVTLNNILRSQSLWVEARWKGRKFPRHQVVIDIDNSCADSTVTGCAATGTLVWNEDFDRYDDGLNSASNAFSKEGLLPGMTTYLFADTDADVSGHTIFREGYYAIVKRGVNEWPRKLFTDDHTSPHNNRVGRFLLINGKGHIDKVYEQTVAGFCPGTTLYFSFWMRGSNAQMRWTVYSANDSSALATFLMPALPYGYTTPWRQYGFRFTVPDNVDSVFFNIYNYCVAASGNDFAIDDIEVRFCVAPIVARANGATNAMICHGDSVRLTVDPYTDDGTLIVSTTDRLEGYWMKSATGDINQASDWSEIPGTRVTGGNGDNTLTVPPFVDAAPGDSTVYYRFTITKANAGASFGVNCHPVSAVISATGREQIGKYPDIRLHLCPSPSRLIHLSGYLDTLHFKSVEWRRVSNGSPDFTTNTETTTGELHAEDFPRGTHVYQYNIANECGSGSGRLYVRSLTNSVLASLPDTVVVCQKLPSTAYLQMNQILGLETNGEWDIPVDLQPFVTEPSSYFSGAYVFDAKAAWDILHSDPKYQTTYHGDSNSAVFKFTYNTGGYAHPSKQSCVGDLKRDLVIVVIT